MKGKVLMVQGTASNVGKSVLVTALCRIFKQDGFRVAPFKAQNMSNNSYATPDGGEIGRAQAVQAEAAGIQPSVEMNPILLKPEANSRSQVVVMGRPEKSVAAVDYYGLKSLLWPVVTGALRSLRSQYDIVIIEGAGSPAEINLAANEIVNMRLARHCHAPVLLVGDIDRGGVFAALLGTLWLLRPADRSLVKAIIINKFRGDRTLLEPGLKILEKKAGVPVAGVIPYFSDIHIAPEDSVALEQVGPGKMNPQLDIAVIRLPHISNFDDFDPLNNEKDVSVRYVDSVERLGVPDLIILPGSKTTIADLGWLEESGLASRIIELSGQGVFIIGICGGYQMLGEHIQDPNYVESGTPLRKGLGLLPVTTHFLRNKETHQIKGDVLVDRGLLTGACGQQFEGYEIHMGQTVNETETSFRIHERSGKPCEISDGCLDASGRILGTYIHGLFHNRVLRQSILQHVARSKNHVVSFCSDDVRGREYDRLADLIRRGLDMDLIYQAAGIFR
ncbi:MAG: cobyric acid synthase [Chloroflexi bacterium]|nr:cobyric acid synthase [Chloroflexota bacterium]